MSPAPLRLALRLVFSGVRPSSVAGVLLLATLGLLWSSASTQPGTKEREWAISAPLADQSLLLDAARTPEGAIAVGDRGHVLLSRDGGRTWAQTPAPTRTMLCAVAVEGNQCWAVGHDALILHSDDGGGSWTQQYSAPEDEEPLFDVWFADRDRGVAVGAYGRAMVTFDGGDEWELTSFGELDAHLYDISAAEDGTLYVAGEFGTILRSTDDAQTWDECASPYGGSFFGILPLPDGAVLVFGLRGNLYRSTDQADSWTRIPTGTTASLLDGAVLGDGSVIVAGLSGCVLVSEDGGRSFVDRSRDDRAALSTVLGVEGGILLLGEDGALLLDPDSIPGDAR